MKRFGKVLQSPKVLTATFFVYIVGIAFFDVPLRRPVPSVPSDAPTKFLEGERQAPDATSLRLPSTELMAESSAPFDVHGTHSYASWIAHYVQDRRDVNRQAGYRSCVSAAPNRVYLSFDDAPVPGVTSQILDVLARHRVRAMIFAIGAYAEKNGTDDLRRGMAEGHIIGNHTFLHLAGRWYDDRRLLESEVSRTEAILGPLLGPPKLFRFPWGAASRDAVTAVEGFGYQVCGWNIDSYDWCFLGPNCSESDEDLQNSPFLRHGDLAGWTLYAVRHRGGGLLLMHNIYVTAVALEGILEGLMRPESYWRRLPQAQRDEYIQYYSQANVPPDTRFTIADPHNIE